MVEVVLQSKPCFLSSALHSPLPCLDPCDSQAEQPLLFPVHRAPTKGSAWEQGGKKREMRSETCSLNREENSYLCCLWPRHKPGEQEQCRSKALSDPVLSFCLFQQKMEKEEASRVDAPWHIPTTPLFPLMLPPTPGTKTEFHLGWAEFYHGFQYSHGLSHISALGPRIICIGWIFPWGTGGGRE